jgi:hypothetical protein
MVLATLLAAGLAAAVAPVGAETMRLWTELAQADAPTGPQPFIVFRFRNRSGSSIGVAFYSETRRWCWPACDRHYPIHNGEEKTYHLNCQLNERICWGAWNLSDSDTYWGAGMGNSERCQRCCYVCNGRPTPWENINP